MNSIFNRISKEALAGPMEKVLIRRLPRSGVIHNVMQLFLKDRYSNHVDTRFYAYEGITQCPEKSFIVSLQYRSFFGDIAISISEPEDRKLITPEMYNALKNLIDWKSRLAIKTTLDSNIIGSWCEEQGKVALRETCFSYYMDIIDALKIRPKPVSGYQIGMLKPQQGIHISKIFSYKHFPNTAANMIDSIESVGGVGVYQSGHLRCWVIISTNGQLFALYVDEKYRKRGLAEWALATMSKVAAQEGLLPNAMIVQNNKISQLLCEKIGFKRGYETIEVIRYIPHK